MSAERAWKPGNVAAVKCSDGEWRQATCEPHSNWPDVFVWRFPDRVYRHMDSEARPLVVIDPEDHEAVERLTYVVMDHYWSERYQTHSEAFRAGLREYIEPPAPPRPPEPTGLGAVVEDSDGKFWIRTADTDCTCPWARASAYEEVDYDQIEAIKVLSEGVTP